MNQIPEIIKQTHAIEETSVEFSGDWQSSYAIAMKNSWHNAMALQHKLPDRIKTMTGMSGKKYRYFINNLVDTLPDARYLEIGSHSGSTACAAMWLNKCQVTCIDNWSEFGGPRDLFFHNINQCLTPDIDFSIKEQDFRQVDYTDIGKYNIYMFDGPHQTQDQYDGLALVEPALDSEFILIVDDWNWLQVQNGTKQALNRCGYQVVCCIAICTHQKNQHPVIANQFSDWHNGYFIALVKRQPNKPMKFEKPY